MLTLIELARQQPGRELAICDVGTGSGIIAVTAAKHLPASRITATDVSPAALGVASSNAERHGVLDRIEFIESDLFAAISPESRFDFVVSNPPYVSEAEMASLAPEVRLHEPRVALVAGCRGTETIEALVQQAAEHLVSGGHLLVEISPMIREAVEALVAADPRYEPGPTVSDLARLPRVVQARRK